MGRGPAVPLIYCGMSGKELERCMATSPVTPFLSSSSQYVCQFNKLTRMLIIVLSYRWLVKLRQIWWDFLLLHLYIAIHSKWPTFSALA